MNGNYQDWAKETAKKIAEKMEWVSEKSKDKIPYTTVNGTHDNRLDPKIEFTPDNGPRWWCNGFWAGMMWLMYHETGNVRYREIGEYTEKSLDSCFDYFYGLHHDVGFMWLPSAVADYRLTGSEDGKRRGLHAAALLAGRFNPVGRFIRAWNDPIVEAGKEAQALDNRGWAIIDCLMNIPLLYWASDMTKDPRFKQIAMLHADRAMECFVRPDGSVRHIVEFDPFTGVMVRDYGGQGYGDGSSWTRGQAWGLYGFVISYIHTGKQEYLDTAKKIAHYFMANIPESGLIPVDFRQPKKPAWEDSTAAAIAASGLLEISRQVGEYERDLYLNAAIKLLKTLEEKRCSWGRENDCILEKCTAAYHEKDHEFNIIYGDYYFMEAVFKLKGDDVFLW